MARMTRTLTAAVLCTLLCFASTSFAAGLSGAYIAEFTTGPTAEKQYARVSMKTDGTTVIGTWGERTVSGTVSGSRVELTLADASGPAGTLTGTMNGSGVSGSGTIKPATRGGFGGGAPQNAAITFTLTPYTPPSAPKTYDYEPTSFYSTYSAQWAPVLRIYPGDSVRTRTVDNDRDAAATRYGVGGNPSTGPFYIEGALPGDTLVVHLKKVRANKKTARQGTRINARAITAQYLVNAKYDPAFSGEWNLDLEKGVATLAHPTETMKGFSVPIKAMLGCVSVAPSGMDQARGTDLGTYGGNLDYNDNVEGTTLYFPVYHAGALFGIGDAHAAMGDAEVTGSALETSADVEFSVDVIKGENYPQVRAETSEYLISFGVSGSVAESIQAATAQLADWLKADYKMTDSEVALFLGAVAKYDIAELVDPHVNIVAKVPKRALASFKKR